MGEVGFSFLVLVSLFCFGFGWGGTEGFVSSFTYIYPRRKAHGESLIGMEF